MRQSFLIVTFFLFGSTSFGQSKQGYIDYMKVVETLPEYRIGQKQLEERRQVLQDSIELISAVYLDFAMNGLPHDRELDSVGKVRYELKLMALEKNTDDFVDYVMDALIKNASEMESTLREVIIKKLEEFSAAKNIDCIVEKGSILHCSDCYDFTDNFIDFINSNKK